MQMTHHKILISTNLLLTEREGRTGEYWPEVVAVRTERSEVRTKTTEGQYSTEWLEQARLVSSLLYGTLSLIVKCTSGGLHLKMFVFSTYLWNFGKISIFLFSSDSFNVKNDIIHTFFSLFWLQIFNLPASLQNKNTRIGPFPLKRSVLQNPDRERTNQRTGICLRLGLPYNKLCYCCLMIMIFTNLNDPSSSKYFLSHSENFTMYMNFM